MSFLESIAGPIAGALLGGGFSAVGASKQNAANQAAAQAANAFTERQFRNRYQWTMEDMKKAGLNPILAYKQGGGSSGSGQSYQSVNVGAAAAEGAQRGSTSAIALRRAESEIKNINADTVKKGAETYKANNEGRNAIDAGFILREQLHSAKSEAAQSKITQKIYEDPGVFATILKYLSTIKGATIGK